MTISTTDEPPAAPAIGPFELAADEAKAVLVCEAIRRFAQRVQAAWPRCPAELAGHHCEVQAGLGHDYQHYCSDFDGQIVYWTAS